MAYIEIGSLIQTEADYENGGHVTAFPELAEEIVKVVENSFKATSSSTVAIGAGSKVFVTDVRVPWTLNTPLRAHDTVSDTKFLDGKITAITHTSTSSTVTINVPGSGDFSGSGSHSSWVLFPFTRAYTTVSSPATESEGGWAATTFATGRKNAQVARQVDIIGVCKTPPSSASTGDKVLVDSSGLTGDYVGQGNKIATKGTSPAWTFETAILGDMCFDKGVVSPSERSGGEAYSFYTYAGVSRADSIGTTGGYWINSSQPNREPRSDYVIITANTTIDYTYHGKTICTRATSGSITLTLSHSVPDAYEGISIRIVNDNSNSSYTTTVSGVFQKDPAGVGYQSGVVLLLGQSLHVIGTNETGSTLNFIGIKSAPLEDLSLDFKGSLLYTTTEDTVGAASVVEIIWDAQQYDALNCWTSGSRFTVPTSVTKCRVTLRMTGIGNGYFELINIDDVNQKGRFKQAFSADFPSDDDEGNICVSSLWMNVTPGHRFAIQATGGTGGMSQLLGEVGIEFEY